MSTKTVTFGGVFTFPMNLKEKKEAEVKSAKNRFNCGALRNSLKMVSANGSTLIAVRLVRSKLRKREEHGSVTTNHNNNVIQTSDVVVSSPPPPPAEPPLPPPFFWRYSSSQPSNNSSQFSLCNNDQANLVHTLPCEEPSECKGFRKNLRGKWRRLVKKKPQQEVYTIPAELRDQLKQIYVY